LDELSVSNQPKPIENGIFKIPVLLDQALEPQREILESMLLAAQTRLRAFATTYGWQAHVQRPFATQAHIYATKAGFDHDLLEVSGMDTTIELPRTYCAALEQDILMCVSPALYQEIYPEGDGECAFEKLITHEMAHRLHIRILGGDEDAMGPVWFYEGFALFAASQFEQLQLTLTLDDMWRVMGEAERGSYKQYAAVFRHLVGKVSLLELVQNAGREDFTDWLKRKYL
jgi:hypothetical protein